MASYSCTAQFFAKTLASTALLPIFEIRSAPTCLPLIKRLGLHILSGGANQAWSFGISLGDSTTSTISLGNSYDLLVPEDPYSINNAMVALTVYSEWAVKPPSPTTYLRRAVLRNSIVSQVQPAFFNFRFQRGLSLMPPTETLIVWFIAPAISGPTFQLDVEIDT